MFVLASFVLYSAHFPLGSSYIFCGSVFGLLIISVPLTFLSIYGNENKEMVKGAYITLTGMYIALYVFIAIVVKFKLSGRPLIAGKRKLQTDSDG